MYHFISSKKLNSSFRFLPTMLLLTFIMTGFQNCYMDFSGETQASQNSTSSDRGFINTISTDVSGSGSSLAGDKFSINTNLELTVENIHPNSSEVHWSVSRGFEDVIENAKTSGGVSQHTFTQAGAYDISAISYNNVNDFLTPIGSASKRVVIGEDCDASKVLEIVLTSGTLVTGQTATFGVKNESQFSGLSWKATLPSGSEVEAEGTSIEVNLASQSVGTLKVEVSASEANESECLTFRSKNFDINNNLTPHFSEVKIVDGDDNDVSLTLENNDIYKYEKSSDSRFVSMDIKDATNCILKESSDEDGNERSIECEGGKVDITTDSTTECSETVIRVRAEYGSQDDDSSGVQSISHVYIDPKTSNPGTNTDPTASGNNGGSQTSASSSQYESDPKAPVNRDGYESDPRVSSSKEETFYYYCPEDSTSCYFGLQFVRPAHHTCGAVIPPTYQKYTKSVEISATEEVVKPKLDIVFIWDTSLSMNDDVEDFAATVDNFLSTLDAEYDFRIGVLVGNGALSPRINDFSLLTARLVNNPDEGEPYVLDSQTMSIEDMRYYMAEKLDFIHNLTALPNTQTQYKAFVNDGESPLFSLYHSIQGRFLVENQNHGFFREDAALSIVLLADENDLCSRYPGHFPNHEFSTGGNDTEEIEALQFCEGITTDNILTALKNFKGDQPVTISGLLAGNDNPGYRKLIEDHGVGSVLTVEDNNYDELLPVVTETIKKEIPPEGTIEIALDHTSIFAEATEVFLETSTGRVAVPFYYDEVSNIVFARVELGAVGTIHVEYYAP